MFDWNEITDSLAGATAFAFIITALAGVMCLVGLAIYFLAKEHLVLAIIFLGIFTTSWIIAYIKFKNGTWN